MGCGTNQRFVALGYLLQLLVQRHQGLFIFFVKSVPCLPRLVKEKETVDQESL